VVTGLELVDAKTPRNSTRVLIDGDGWAILALVSADLDRKMEQATPFLGCEQPGAKLLRVEGWVKRARQRVKVLPFPVRITVFWLDNKGAVDQLQTATIQQLESS
jgi:hypothetical protein